MVSFTFITYTSEPGKATGKELSAIRTHTSLTRNLRIKSSAVQASQSRRSINVSTRSNVLTGEVPIDFRESVKLVRRHDNLQENADIRYLQDCAISEPSPGFRVDPFNSTPAGSDQYAALAIEYFVYALADIWAPLVSFDGKMNWAVDVVLPASIQAPSLFHSMIAGSRTSQLMTSGQSPSEAAHDHGILMHHGEALSNIQKSLIDVNDDTLLIAILWLCTLDHRFGNTAALASHNEGLRLLLRLRSHGVSTCPSTPIGHIAHTILSMMAANSVISLDSPSPSEAFAPKRALAYPQHPFPLDLCLYL